jgi:hypothetical protein
MAVLYRYSSSSVIIEILPPDRLTARSLQPMMPQEMSQLRSEIQPGVLATNDQALVLSNNSRALTSPCGIE